MINASDFLKWLQVFGVDRNIVFVVKQNCYAGTPTNLVGTYANGASGVGATFTLTATTAFSIDGVTPLAGSRIYVLNQTDARQNGIYVLTVAGGAGVHAVLTRASDYDNSIGGEIEAGDGSFIQNGTLLGGTQWYLTTPGIIVLGTSSLNYAQANFINTGTGLTKTSPNTIAIADTSVTPGSYGGANKALQLTVNAQGQLINVSELDPTLPIIVVTEDVNPVLPNVIYVSNGESSINFFLTNGYTTNDAFYFRGMGVGGFSVVQSIDDQYITIGNVSTSPGLGGTVQSFNSGDELILQCMVDDTWLKATKVIGNFTLRGGFFVGNSINSGQALDPASSPTFAKVTLTEALEIAAALANFYCGPLVRDPSAMFQLDSSPPTQGSIPAPRMDATSFSAIDSKAEALQAWDGVAHRLMIFDSIFVQSVAWLSDLDLYLLKENNLSDVPNALTALANLGLLGKQLVANENNFAPTSVNGALVNYDVAPGNANNSRYFNFAASGTSQIFAQITLPKNITKTSFTFSIIWEGSNTNTGNVVFFAKAVLHKNGTSYDAAYGSSVSITSAGPGAANQQVTTSDSATVTPSNISSPPDNAKLDIVIFRAGGSGSDTFTGDAHVKGILINMTQNAGNLV